MRWLFLLLVAVNITIYVWGVQREMDISTELDPRYRIIGEIKLLSKADMEEGPTVEQESENSNSGEPTVGSEPQLGIEENSFATTFEASESDLTQESVLQAEMEEVAVVSTGSPEEDGESTETAVPPVLPAAEVTEEPPLARVEELQPAVAETVVVQELLCLTLGPVNQRPAALTILKAVEKRAVSAVLREATEKNITGYWVVLPPYENAGTANEVVNQLKAQNVSDVQRFYKGEFQNGVSLGIYNQRFNAEKRRAQIEAKGFFPEVLPRYKEVPAYWVDYRSENEVDVLSDLSSDYRDLAVTQQKCDN